MNIEIILPSGAMGASEHDSFLDTMLREIAMAIEPDQRLSWSEKYGADFENDVFMMHHYCWCEEEECPWCSGEAPNFIYKPSDLKIQWYKYIGRDTETNRPVTESEIAEMKEHCLASLKEEKPNDRKS